MSSITMHALAILPADETRKAKVDVYERDVGEWPSPDTMPIQLCDAFPGGRRDIEPHHECATGWTDGDMCHGIVVDVAKLPPGTRYIRFYGAW